MIMPTDSLVLDVLALAFYIMAPLSTPGHNNASRSIRTNLNNLPGHKSTEDAKHSISNSIGLFAIASYLHQKRVP